MSILKKTVYLTQTNNVDIVYIEFAKAFDKVDFNILLTKISQLGIGGKLERWLHSFLSNRTQRVIVNGKLPGRSLVLSGIPQGSVLGPLLFILLIGDIDDGLLISILSSFADDTRIAAAVNNVSHASKLQTDLETVYGYGTLGILGMAHVFGIAVGSVLFYDFYLSMFAIVFVSVIYYFE